MSLKMITTDKAALHRRIATDNVPTLIGESAYWYCPACHKWRTSPITKEGITCSVCGGKPDWEKRPPTLAYASRYNRVVDLCAPGSEWRKSYDALEQRYGDFIDEVNSGLPLHTQDAGWRYFGNAWKMVDKLGDYLMTAPDAPMTDTPYAYSEEGLQRRYFRPKRKYNTSTLSDIWIKHEDGGGGSYSDEEATEMMSLRVGFTSPFFDQAPILDELLCNIPDGLEYKVAYDFAKGLSKRDVERRYELTEGKVRTIVRHIAKHLKDM